MQLREFHNYLFDNKDILSELENLENFQKKLWFAYFTEQKELYKNLIASIPFIRNLAQYCGYGDEFQKLTSLLHIKSDTNSLTIQDLETIFKAVLKDKITKNQTVKLIKK